MYMYTTAPKFSLSPKHTPLYKYTFQNRAQTNKHVVNAKTKTNILVERWISWFLASLKVAANCEMLVV